MGELVSEYAPDLGRLTKNEHFQAMFAHVVAEGNLQDRTLLVDAWYRGGENLKRIHRAGWTFFTTLKSNRLVSLSKKTGHQALEAVAPPPGGWSTGLEVRLKQVPFAVRLFKPVVSNDDIEWAVTNNFAFTLTQQLVEATTRPRWQVEEFHRSFKQFTGAEKCQCRRAQGRVSPKNQQQTHIGCPETRSTRA